MSRHPDVAEPQVNVTPLIDVMLVLLVILIITLPVATHAVKLNLPQGDIGAPPEATSLRPSSSRAGGVFFKRYPLAPAHKASNILSSSS